MKAAIIVACALLAGACLSGCASTKENKTVIVAQAEETEKKTVVEQLPSPESFEKIPDEAVNDLNYCVSVIKDTCPTEKKAKRLYGYVGEENIEDADCYVFCVYDQKKSETLFIGKVAKVKGEDRVYLAKDEEDYTLLDTEKEPEWAETVTACYADVVSE